MKRVEKARPKVHFFVCQNERPEPQAQVCCRRVGGDELGNWLKQKVREAGLVKEVYVTKTRCLGFCNDKGAVVVAYSEGREPLWWAEIASSEYEEFWNEVRNTFSI